MGWSNYTTYENYEYQIKLFSLQFPITLYSLYILTPIAFIGNLVIVLVFNTKELKKHSISFYFSANAIFDTLDILVVFAQYFHNTYYSSTLTDFTCGFYTMFSYALPIISCFISMMATVDRLRFVVYSAKFKFMERKWFQYAFMSTTTLIFIGGFIPFGFNQYSLNSICYDTIVILSNVYNWIFFALSTVLPNIVIFTCTIRLMVAIRQSKKKFTKNSNNKKTKNGNQMIKNILAINILFLTTNSLNAVMNIVYTTVPDSVYYNSYGRISIAMAAFYILQLFNFSCPVFVHFFTNKTFSGIIKSKLKFFYQSKK